MAYFDAATDRIGDVVKARFNEMVEAVRMGTGFLHDHKAYARWRAETIRTPHDTKGDLAKLIRAAGGGIRTESEFRN